MNHRKTILWLFVASLAIRLLLVFIHTEVKLADEMNGYDYGARKLLEGKGLYSVQVELQEKKYRPFRAWLPPGYSLFLAGIYGIFGHSFLAARLIQAILGAFSVVLAYLLARHVFESEKVAALGAWILAFYPQSVQFADLLQTETLFLFLFLLAMLSFVKALKGASWRHLVASGLLFGLAALVKSFIMFYVLAIGAYLLFFVRDKAMIKKTIIVALLMLATISPWTIRNYLLLDAFVPINTKAGWDFFQHNHSGFRYIIRNQSDEPGEDIADNLAKDEDGYITELRLSQVCQQLALKWIRENPHLLLFKGIRQQWNVFSLERSFFVNLRRGYYGDVPKWLLLIAGPYMGLPFMLLLPLAIVGFVYTRKDNLYLRMILILFGYFMLIAFVAFLFYRQRYPLLPFLCCFAAIAILRRKEVLADVRNRKEPAARRRLLLSASLIAFYAVGWIIDIGLSVATLTDTF